MVAGRRSSTSCPTAATSGASIASRAAAWCRWRCSAAELAGPLWQLGARWYDFLDEATALAIATGLGRSQLVALDLATGAGHAARPAVRRVSPGSAAPAAAPWSRRCRTTARPSSSSTGRRVWTTLATAGALDLDPALIARAEHVSFPSSDGRQAFALYYPPTNPDCAAPAGELPPLVVRSHGGPTGRASPALEPADPVLDQPRLRRGRRRLCRQHRLRPRLPQPARWPAGASPTSRTASRPRAISPPPVAPIPTGWRSAAAAPAATPPCARSPSTTCFKAGASWYGIGDLEALLRDTHKFESRYLDRLIGPWPEAAAIYRARSPLHHADAAELPGHLPPGPGRQGGAAQPGRGHGRGPARQGRAGGLSRLPGRGPRLSRRRGDRAAPCSPSTPSSAGCSASRRPSTASARASDA